MASVADRPCSSTSPSSRDFSRDSSVKLSKVDLASRVLASLVAGYTFCWGFVTLGIALLLLRGVPYGDAQTALYLVAFIVFLIVFLWSFVVKSLIRLWLTLVGGGITMTAIAWGASHAFLR